MGDERAASIEKCPLEWHRIRYRFFWGEKRLFLLDYAKQTITQEGEDFSKPENSQTCLYVDKFALCMLTTLKGGTSEKEFSNSQTFAAELFYPRL